MVLVDTSVWVDFFNGVSSREAGTLATLIAGDEPVAITGIIVTEILQGLKSDRQAEKIQNLLTAFEYLDEMPSQDYARAAKIYRDCRAKGLTIRSTIDCVIAQIAVTRDARLLAKDRDFEAIARTIPLRLQAALQ